MRTRREDKAKAIFLDAIELDLEKDRRTHIEAQCGDDDVLRREVEELLRHKEQMGDFLISAPPDLSGTIDQSSHTEGPGTLVGRYKLLQEIGEGGFGMVYMAEQQEPVVRKVALKIIKLGMDTKQVVARFEAERQALAMMDHPNIAKMHDAGTTDSGRPYFVMELVRGIPITEYCDENKLDTKERLKLFIDVCRAVQHAHQKGIIHRDIKPNNVMITLRDGEPVPKVIDFGIAKATQRRLTEKTLFTDYHQFIGTPQYMSPEQATMSEHDVDTRSDIYSLGVLFYELLVGCTPFEAEQLRDVGYDKICQIINEVDPPTPSRRLSRLGEAAITTISEHRRTLPTLLQRLVRGDLDWIAIKALEKDRTRRYVTANDFGEDIQRYLNNVPVDARRPSTTYAFRKFARRNRTLLTSVTLVAAALLIGTVVSAWLAVNATVARRDTEQARRKTEDLRYGSDMTRAIHALSDNDRPLVRELLRGHHPALPSSDGIDRRGWEWYYLWRACRDTVPTFRHEHIVNEFALSPDGTSLVSGDTGGNLNLWDVSTHSPIDSAKAHRSYVLDVEFLPDGTLVSSGQDDDIRFWRIDHDNRSLHINDTLDLEGNAEWNWQRVAYSTNGEFLASGGLEKIRLWDIRKREIVAVFPNANCFGLALHPEGMALAAHCGDSVKIWSRPYDADKDPWIISEFDNTGSMTGLAFSPDGRLVAASWKANGAQLWNVERQETVCTLQSSRHASATCIDFSPEGESIAMGSTDKSVTIWDTATGVLLRKLMGHSGAISDVQFTADGKTLASSSRDKTVRLWPLGEKAKAHAEEILHVHLMAVDDVAFSPDGMWLATSAALTLPEATGGEVLLWDTNTWRQVHKLSGRKIAFSPDSRLLAVSGAEKNLQLWDLKTSQPMPSLPFESLHAEFSPNGNLALCGWQSFQLWQPYERRRIAKFDADVSSTLVPRTYMDFEFSPNGQTLAWVDVQGDVALLNAKTLKIIEHRPDVLAYWGYSVAFSPNGHYLVTPDLDHTLKVWDVRDGKLKPFRSLRRHTDGVICAAFSCDGRLAVGCANGKVKLWDSSSWTERGTLKCHDRRVTAIRFSPDGNTLITGSEDGTVAMFQAASREEVIDAEQKGEDPLDN